MNNKGKRLRVLDYYKSGAGDPPFIILFSVFSNTKTLPITRERFFVKYSLCKGIRRSQIITL